MRKTILFTLMVASLSLSAQIRQLTLDISDSGEWVTISDATTDQTKTRFDTVHGLIFYVLPIVIESEQVVWCDTADFFYLLGSTFDTVGYDTRIDLGIRIDTIDSRYGKVECPDKKAGTYWSCAVCHYGWTDRRRGYSYHTDQGAIKAKNVIHFIPN